jgi:hypothetical protein
MQFAIFEPMLRQSHNSESVRREIQCVWPSGCLNDVTSDNKPGLTTTQQAATEGPGCGLFRIMLEIAPDAIPCDRTRAIESRERG